MADTFYTPAVSRVYIAIGLSVRSSTRFGSISQTIQIIFCIQLLFKMRMNDTKFRFDPKSMMGLGGAQSQNYHSLYLKITTAYI